MSKAYHNEFNTREPKTIVLISQKYPDSCLFKGNLLNYDYLFVHGEFLM
jgi:hypothetical protein